MSRVRRSGARLPWSSMTRLNPEAYPPTGNRPELVVDSGSLVDWSVPREKLADCCVHELRMRDWVHVSQRLELYDFDLRENPGQESGHASRGGWGAFADHVQHRNIQRRECIQRRRFFE